MTENALSILIVIFSAQLQQTEISERKLFIFHLGGTGLSIGQLTLSGPSVTICDDVSVCDNSGFTLPMKLNIC